MSVRAYRIAKPAELAKEPSFNMWHDKNLIEFMQENGEYSENLNDSGDGWVETDVATLELVIKEYPFAADDESTIRAIQADIAFAKANDQDWVTYECY